MTLLQTSFGVNNVALVHGLSLIHIFTGIGRHHTANADIRMKILTNHLRREIIVNAAIISKRTVYFYRFEDKWLSLIHIWKSLPE